MVVWSSLKGLDASNANERLRQRPGPRKERAVQSEKDTSHRRTDDFSLARKSPGGAGSLPAQTQRASCPRSQSSQTFCALTTFHRPCS